jgi:hypothetical protein
MVLLGLQVALDVVLSRGGSRLVHEYRLSAARTVESARGGVRHKVRVTWDGAEDLIGGLDRKSVERLIDRCASEVRF